MTENKSDCTADMGRAAELITKPVECLQFTHVAFSNLLHACPPNPEAHLRIFICCYDMSAVAGCRKAQLDIATPEQHSPKQAAPYGQAAFRASTQKACTSSEEASRQVLLLKATAVHMHLHSQAKHDFLLLPVCPEASFQISSYAKFSGWRICIPEVTSH